MRKIVTIFALLVIIAATVTFSLLYVSFNLTDPSNKINQTFRRRVLSSAFFSTILRLDQVGDARYQLIYNHTLPLSIHLYYQRGVEVTPETIKSIPTELYNATHKFMPVTYTGPDIIDNLPDKVTDKDIHFILDTYQQPLSLFPQNVQINIFVLRYFLPHSSYAGLVEDAHSIFLFTDAIQNVSGDPEAYHDVEISTILHEFAHLAGAEHITTPNCILNDTVENLNFYEKITDIQISYCSEDIEAINSALTF